MQFSPEVLGSTFGLNPFRFERFHEFFHLAAKEKTSATLSLTLNVSRVPSHLKQLEDHKFLLKIFFHCADYLTVFCSHQAQVLQLQL